MPPSLPPADDPVQADRGATRHATSAIELAAATGNDKALVDALLTSARTARRRGDAGGAIAALERSEAAAADGPPARLRQVLSERSELAAEAGDHATAYELGRRALALG